MLKRPETFRTCLGRIKCIVIFIQFIIYAILFFLIGECLGMMAIRRKLYQKRMAESSDSESDSENVSVVDPNSPKRDCEENLDDTIPSRVPDEMPRIGETVHDIQMIDDDLQDGCEDLQDDKDLHDGNGDLPGDNEDLQAIDDDLQTIDYDMNKEDDNIDDDKETMALCGDKNI